MTDWQRSLESMSGSLDQLKRRFESFNPTAQSQSHQGYVHASISFDGAVVFDIDSAAADPDEGVDLEAEVVEAYNRALAEVAQAARIGLHEVLPGLADHFEER